MENQYKRFNYHYKTLYDLSGPLDLSIEQQKKKIPAVSLSLGLAIFIEDPMKIYSYHHSGGRCVF